MELETSSILKWGCQNNSKPVCFFFTKRFWAYKKHQRFPPSYKILCAKKTVVFVVFCSLIFCFCWLVLVDMRFCTRKIFSQKNKLTYSCLGSIILLYYWRVPLSTHLSSLYFHAFVFICNHLLESIVEYNGATQDTF